MRFLVWASLIGLVASGPAPEPPPERAARVAVEELTLDNGMRFLLVSRPEATTVAAGWVARVGSGDERPGLTGVSHLLEHMLFKGTRTVGARDADAERRLLAEEDRLRAELRELGTRTETARRRRQQLESRIDRVAGEARATAFLGELSLLYSEAGAVGLNANTLRDLTMFYVTLPAERLETWFWLESDRLREPVLREFYKERRVVREERRLRTDSTPTGRLDAGLRALFWGDHPYSWQPMGRPDDLDLIDRPAARAFFRAHYRPHRLAAALVGGFDPAAARRLAGRYFGRLPKAGDEGPGAAGPLADWRHAPGRLDESCDCPTQIRLLYPTVPFAHPDAAALEVLAELLNGASGRLQRSLVLERGLAVTAAAGSFPLRRAGYFSLVAEARSPAAPEQLLAAWEQELGRLAAQPVPEAELRRVRSRLAADLYRRLKDPLGLLQRLLIYDGLGDWRQINELPAAVLAVTGGEARDAARRYLRGARPTVGIFRDRRHGEAGHREAGG